MTMSDTKHAVGKFIGTVRILFKLGMARTFGKYQYSGWDGEVHFARYYWRGRDWLIPTGPCAAVKSLAEEIRAKSSDA